MTKFYLTVYNIIWALNTKVMKILERDKMIKKDKETKMKSNKPLKIKNPNLKEKTLSLPLLENLKKNLNAKINETTFDLNVLTIYPILFLNFFF